MKKTTEILYVMLVTCCLPLFIYCSGSDIAGGAGTGNPGKTTFAIVARDTVTALQLQKSLDVHDIVIPDSAKNFFHVDSFYVILRRIHFIFSPEDKPRIDAINVLPPLRKDVSSVVLEGPFIFDAISGIPDSIFGAVLLPDANYTAVKLVIENKPDKNSIFLGGTFWYLGEMHKFRFDLSLNVSVTYENDKGVYISGSDSTAIKVELDASKWFANINIEGCINSQASPFGSGGVFVLNGKIDEGICAEIPRKINDNIVKSGKLKINQVKLK
ncbi:MAG TPA: hypothetical protein VHO70_21060 [Chitinispirillaceae bacterium]|nr:hypothetical protein [Chitinispirillaceae bacterium]